MAESSNGAPLVVSFGEMLIDFVPDVSGVSLAESSGFIKAPGGAQQMSPSPSPSSAAALPSSARYAVVPTCIPLPLKSSSLMAAAWRRFADRSGSSNLGFDPGMIFASPPSDLECVNLIC
ncbi:hypothetical protein HPP92_001825 [Vanilla planifolia]|uniref:Fructokinase n=1 Tax=Vanilla planifolia TaxID=51239 RepID=A0A835SDI1_VANPL|nr:hypothetical protein HPP92_001825 [Vanilla planifolia]